MLCPKRESLSSASPDSYKAFGTMASFMTHASPALKRDYWRGVAIELELLLGREGYYGKSQNFIYQWFVGNFNIQITTSIIHLITNY